jgi:glutamate synthase (NADPH/NADH) small chain
VASVKLDVRNPDQRTSKESLVTEEKKETLDRKARLRLPPQTVVKRAPDVRVDDWKEAYVPWDEQTARLEAMRCIQCPAAPCSKACPLHNKIPEYLALLENGDIAGAASRLRETNPMPEVCSRLCPQERQCEGNCVLAKNSRAVAVGRIEVFITDYVRQNGGWPIPKPPPTSGKRVAVIGGGPAGLTIAEELAKKGHICTVFDAWPQPGGLLLYGIPSFKMDKAIVDERIAYLTKLGVEFRPNTVVGEDVTVDGLLDNGFSAVFLGYGATRETALSIPGRGLGGEYEIAGNELAGVYWAMDFLLRANVPPEKLPERLRRTVEVGKRVAVIGGGDTAMDCLRTALRLGAERVTCVYRRSEAEMPGRAEERKNAREEGADFHFLATPVSLLGDAQRHVRKIECQRMELGEPDESGRRRPVPVEGSEFLVDADTVVFALGFGVEGTPAKGCDGLETDRWGQVTIDPETGATSRPGVFAGGDCAHGADLVVTAIVDALRAAQGIHSYLTESGG